MIEANMIGTGEAMAGELVPMPVTYYRDLVGERMRSAPAMTLSQFVDHYATTREIVPETVRQYEITAQRFEEWAGRPVLLTELNELMVSAWIRYLATVRKPATVRGKRNMILALWRAAGEEYFCDPPTRRVRGARVVWVPPTAWSFDEVCQLVRQAERLDRRHSCGLWRREWWSLAIRIAWDTGLRWGDQMKVRTGDVYGDVIIRQQSKTGRPVAGKLKPSTVAMLNDTLARCPRELVTPWIKSHETFNAQMRRLVRKARVRTGTWKWLRRGGATDVEIQAPGQGLAGKHLGHGPHSKIAAIHYVDPAIVAASIDPVTPRELPAP